MRKILFPTDYSETANSAFRFALQMAKYHEAELYVLHVYDPPVISGHITPSMVDNVHSKRRFDELEKIKAHSPILEEIREEMQLQNVRVFLKVQAGLLIPEITRAIKEDQIDYVVMGTQGSSGIQKKILGSNTLNVISHVHVPILSVPNDAVYKPVKTFIYITRFLPEEEESVKVLIDEAIQRKAFIKMAFVQRKEDTAFEETYERWKDLFKEAPVAFHIFSAEDTTARAALSFIRSHEVDMVAVFQRERGFFERVFSKSLTIQLAKRLKVPLLVFKKQN